MHKRARTDDTAHSIKQAVSSKYKGNNHILINDLYQMTSARTWLETFQNPMAFLFQNLSFLIVWSVTSGLWCNILSSLSGIRLEVWHKTYTAKIEVFSSFSCYANFEEKGILYHISMGENHLTFKSVYMNWFGSKMQIPPPPQTHKTWCQVWAYICHSFGNSSSPTGITNVWSNCRRSLLFSTPVDLLPILMNACKTIIK